MTEREDLLVKYVSDQLGMETHTLQALHQQMRDEDIKRHPEVQEVLDRVQVALTEHVKVLKNVLHGELKQEEGVVANLIRGSLTNASGALAGVYSRVRSEKVSKILRDLYSALCMACLDYTMLHATALALGNTAIAKVAVDHLKDLTPLVLEISDVVPATVVDELRGKGLALNFGASESALHECHEAWSHRHIDTRDQAMRPPQI